MRDLLPLAMPIFLSQAIDVSMVFCDRFFLAELGKEPLAATLTGGILTFLLTTLLLGTLGQITPLVSQYVGAGQKNQSVAVVHQGLIFSAILTPILLSCAYFGFPYLFKLFHHEAKLFQNEVDYFQILSLTVVTASIRMTLANFFVGIGKSLIVVIASLSAIFINLPLAYALIFGEWGFPRWEIQGAAVGTVIASFAPVLILGLYFFSRKFAMEFGTRARWRLRAEIMTKLIRYGLPAGGEMLVNVGGFTFFAMIMYSYSSDVAAATTVVLNWDMVSFLPLMGVSQAASGLVGKYLGAQRKKLAWRSAWTSLKFGWIYAGMITFVYYAFTSSLVHVFARSQHVSDYQVMIRFAEPMLKISCLYFFFDATYSVLGGILKGAGDTLWTMLVSNSLMWSAAFAVYYFKQSLGLTPIGAWVILTVLVFSLGIIFSWRFLRRRWLDILMIRSTPV